jgi:hypothetical protein
MAGFFVLILAAVLIWLFAESKTSRIVGFSIVGIIGVLIAAYIFWRETQVSSRDHPPQASSAPEQPSPQPGTAERAFTELEPSDVGLAKIALTSGVETYSGIDGKQYERPDLRSWTLSGEVTNLSPEHMVKDVTLNVRLYSCPSYFTVPVNEVKFEDLSLICSKIGDRSLGLYDLRLAPKAAKQFSQPFKFANQGNAINWRYWVDVTRVVAQL